MREQRFKLHQGRFRHCLSEDGADTKVFLESRCGGAGEMASYFERERVIWRAMKTKGRYLEPEGGIPDSTARDRPHASTKLNKSVRESISAVNKAGWKGPGCGRVIGGRRGALPTVVLYQQHSGPNTRRTADGVCDWLA